MLRAETSKIKLRTKKGTSDPSAASSEVHSSRQAAQNSKEDNNVPMAVAANDLHSEEHLLLPSGSVLHKGG